MVQCYTAKGRAIRIPTPWCERAVILTLLGNGGFETIPFAVTRGQMFRIAGARELGMKPGVLERRLAAILAADVVGYSRLIGLDEEGTLGG